MGNWKALVLAVTVSAFLTVNVEKDAMAGVQVGVNIGLPSPFVFPAPPPVVVIPGTYVYMVPDIEADILFYHGHWYRPHGGRWFRARSYDGPWVHVGHSHVPRPLIKLPPHYRSVPHGHHRIPHEHLKANWGKWERQKHWHKDNVWRTGWKGHERHDGPKYKSTRDFHGGPEHKQAVRHSAKKGHKGDSDNERGRDKHGKHGGPRD